MSIAAFFGLMIGYAFFTGFVSAEIHIRFGFLRALATFVALDFGGAGMFVFLGRMVA